MDKKQSNNFTIRDQRDAVESLRARGFNQDEIALKTGFSLETVVKIFKAQDKAAR